MKIGHFALVALAAAAGTANAAVLSFSSSTAGGSWTWGGNGSNVHDNTGTSAPIILDIDDNNGPLSTLSVSTQFDANYTLAFAGTTNLGNGAFAYNYLASGSFSFQDVVSGTTLLTVNFSNCLFTARGSATAWFTTASLQGQPGAGASVNMVWSGASLPAYGLVPGPLTGDFGFEHVAINTSGAIPYAGQNPGVGLTNNLPNANWFSEGSFSATTAIPAPGSIALLGAVGYGLSLRLYLRAQRELGYRYELDGESDERSEKPHYAWVCPPCRRSMFAIAQGAMWAVELPMQVVPCGDADRPLPGARYVNDGENSGPLGDEDRRNYHP